MARKKPAPIAGRAMALILMEKPKSETIHAVTVVPMLAPMMTPIDCERLKRPAFTKETTMTVVAEEDWMMLVTTKPESTAEKRLFVMAFKAFLRPWPAALCTPSLKSFIPKRNMPRAPASLKTISRIMGVV